MGGAARHKIVVQVTIGEVHGQGVRIASRCLWDTETDNHASSTFQNPYLYCVAMVFAVYFEVSAPSTPSPPHEIPPRQPAAHATCTVIQSAALNVSLRQFKAARSIVPYGWAAGITMLAARFGAAAC